MVNQEIKNKNNENKMTAVEEKALKWAYDNNKLSKDAVDGFVAGYNINGFSNISGIVKVLESYFNKFYDSYKTNFMNVARSGLIGDPATAGDTDIHYKLEAMSCNIRNLKEIAKELNI